VIPDSKRFMVAAVEVRVNVDVNVDSVSVEGEPGNSRRNGKGRGISTWRHANGSLPGSR